MVAGSRLRELQCRHVAIGSLISEYLTGRDGYAFEERFAPITAAWVVCSLGS